jgi:hypothetical protein
LNVIHLGRTSSPIGLVKLDDPSWMARPSSLKR